MGKSGEHAVVGQPSAAGAAFRTPNSGGGRKARPVSASSSGPSSSSTPGVLWRGGCTAAVAPAVQHVQAVQRDLCLTPLPSRPSLALQCPLACPLSCTAPAQPAHLPPCLAAAPAAAGGAPGATRAVPLWTLGWMPPPTARSATEQRRVGLEGGACEAGHCGLLYRPALLPREQARAAAQWLPLSFSACCHMHRCHPPTHPISQ